MSKRVEKVAEEEEDETVGSLASFLILLGLSCLPLPPEKQFPGRRRRRLRPSLPSFLPFHRGHNKGGSHILAKETYALLLLCFTGVVDGHGDDERRSVGVGGTQRGTGTM